MKKIAVMITGDFEDSEYTKPAEAFRMAGHELVHIGLEKGVTVKGMKMGTPVMIDKGQGEARPGDYDAMFIPGGYSPDRLRVNDDIVQFAREFMSLGKPVFAICHGPQLLITARALEGYTLTGYKSIAQDIRNARANYVDREVAEDENLITSRYPDDLPAFIGACLNRLGRKEAKAA
jgi:protease I